LGTTSSTPSTHHHGDEQPEEGETSISTSTASSAAAFAYVEKIRGTIRAGARFQPEIFDEEAQGRWDELLEHIESRIEVGYRQGVYRDVSREGFVLESLSTRLRMTLSEKEGSLFSEEVMQAFEKAHRLDIGEGEECITYEGATRGVIRKRRTRIQELVGMVDRGVVMVDSFILYVWTLSYQPGVQYLGLGMYDVCA
jgi:hypothetical protein